MNRRPLSQHDEDLAPARRARGESAILRRALDLARGSDDTLTHGFHSYAARMHAAIARTLIDAAPGQILDPFCGSGTVLVEALRAGRVSFGNDLNPVALRVAEVKCARMNASQRAAFMTAAGEVTELSKDRVRARRDVRAPVHKSLAPKWDGHVLKELGGLWHEIQAREDPHRRQLEVVLSAIVVKFSKQRADTAEEERPRRVGRFIPSEFFLKKCEELARRWAELDEACPARTTQPRLRLGDARELEKPAGQGFDLVITSPPYGGTYDYNRHHALRAPWLRVDVRALDAGELGARRTYSKPTSVDAAHAQWDREVEAFLTSTAQVMSRGGRFFVWMGDGEIGRQRVEADDQLERLAPKAGLEFVGVASVARTDFRGGPPRGEHLVELLRS